jgi:hypothetical protein
VFIGHWWCQIHWGKLCGWAPACRSMPYFCWKGNNRICFSQNCSPFVDWHEWLGKQMIDCRCNGHDCSYSASCIAISTNPFSCTNIRPLWDKMQLGGFLKQWYTTDECWCEMSRDWCNCLIVILPAGLVLTTCTSYHNYWADCRNLCCCQPGHNVIACQPW